MVDQILPLFFKVLLEEMAFILFIKINGGKKTNQNQNRIL